MMLGSLSFLHSSPPVFSSTNTVYPSFLYFIFDIQKDTKPVKNAKGKQELDAVTLARPTIFFPLLLGWVQFLSFLILIIQKRIARVRFKPEPPFLSVCIFVQKSFPLVFKSEHMLYLSFLFIERVLKRPSKNRKLTKHR